MHATREQYQLNGKDQAGRHTRGKKDNVVIKDDEQTLIPGDISPSGGRGFGAAAGLHKDDGMDYDRQHKRDDEEHLELTGQRVWKVFWEMQ